MAQKRKSDQTKLIAEAALSLADKGGWDSLTFKDIAKRAKLRVEDVESKFRDIWAILKWVLKKVEADADEAVRGHLGRDWRDNLAEILMMRFEMAQPHRKAFASLGPSFMRHPQVAPRFARGYFRMLNETLKMSGLSRKLCQPALAAGLGLVHLSLVEVWFKDETPDMSKTMAAIDRRLDLFAQGVDFLKREKSRD